MTKTNMDLSELLAKHDQGDFLRGIAKATFANPFAPAREQLDRELVGRLADRLELEPRLLELMDEKLDQGRLFVVGTGTHIRQETILRLAEHGRGAAASPLPPEIQGQGLVGGGHGVHVVALTAGREPPMELGPVPGSRPPFHVARRDGPAGSGALYATGAGEFDAGSCRERCARPWNER